MKGRGMEVVGFSLSAAIGCVNKAKGIIIEYLPAWKMYKHLQIVSTPDNHWTYGDLKNILFCELTFDLILCKMTFDLILLLCIVLLACFNSALFFRMTGIPQKHENTPISTSSVVDFKKFSMVHGGIQASPIIKIHGIFHIYIYRKLIHY